MADNASDIGAQAFFRGSGPSNTQGATSQQAAGQSTGSVAAGSRPVVVGEEATSAGWGRGPVPVDPRKWKYDRMRALSSEPVQFTATKADRLDADVAGEVLHKIHVTLGIDREEEARILAFDHALWWQHTINGASILQDGRGSLTVGGMEFDISDCLSMIGESQLRRFFRAYADDIREVNLGVLEGYSPYDFVAVEKHGQLMQVAAARGLHKYPELAFDAADACNNISLDARRALQASKAMVIPGVNDTDRMFQRVGNSVRADDTVSRFGK